MTETSQNRLCWRKYIFIIPVVFIMGFHAPPGVLAWLAIATARAFMLVP